MTQQEMLDQLKDHLVSAKSAIILLNSHPSFDQIAASLALADAMQSEGKEVSVACPVEVAGDGISPHLSALQNLEQIQQKLGSQNLSIKFPYQADAVDKVSYHISDDNETFYLIIKPQKGTKPLDASQVSFDYTGADADIVFLIGIHELESLDHLYEGYEELYQQATLVSIHSFETEIGHLKIDISRHVTYSQALVSMLQYLQLPVSATAASNLLAGIEVVTDSFTSPLTSAETFDTVAQLMRQGGRRPRLAKPKQQNMLDGSLAKDDVDSDEAANGSATLFEESKSGDFSLALSKKAKPSASKKKATEPKADSTSKADGATVGGLDYQPGAEGSLGRG